MTRAGKEPAEDVKRAIRRAIEVAGLEVREIRMFKSPVSNGRLVIGWAIPTGWLHEQPAVEMLTNVGFDGTVGKIQIRCSATDGDPLMDTFNAPHVQRCECQLEDLPATLKELWVARREVISRIKAGEVAPIFDGKWNWTIATAGLL